MPASKLTLEHRLLLVLSSAVLLSLLFHDSAVRAEDSPHPQKLRVFNYLSFAGSDRGSIIRLTLDTTAGRIVSQKEIFNDGALPVFHFLEQSADGTFLTFTNLHDDARWVFVLRRSGDELSARRVDLPERGMFTSLSDKTLAVAGNKGGVFLVDLETATVTKSLNLSDSLTPKAHQFGGISFSPNGKFLTVLCSTDSPQGNRVGGRVVILDAASLAVLHDIKLPALFPQLHYGEGSKHNNPVPVELAFGPKSGIASIALENYGGLLLVPSEKLFSGDISDATFIPTSKGGEPGTGFPTRSIFFEHDGREFLLGDSASLDGGLTLIDPLKRERLGWIDTGPESIGGFGTLPKNRAYAYRSGIRDTRGETQTESKHTERPDLLLFDLTPLGTGGLPTVEVIPFEKFLYFAAPIGDSEGRFLLLASLSKEDDRSLKISVYDTINKEIVHREDSIGVLRGFVQEPQNP